MCGVFRGDRMSPRLSRRLRGPGAQRRARRRGVFLCARFLCTSKERWLALSARNAFGPVFRFALLAASTGRSLEAKPKDKNKGNSFRAEARVTFVLAKVTKTAVARRDPDRLRRSGLLRFSDDGARGPNSLRSNKGRSSAPSSCDARLALWLEKQRQDQDQDQRQRQRPDCTAPLRRHRTVPASGCLARPAAKTGGPRPPPVTAPASRRRLRAPARPPASTRPRRSAR